MARVAFIDFDLNRRSQESIAQGALTNSKRPECLVKGVYPTHIKGGQGCFVWDTRGNRFIDFICGLGVNIIGYGNSEIAEAVSIRMRQGVVFSLATDTEVLFAEKIKDAFPFIHKMKFLKTGSEACVAAVRIARAYTGKKYLLSEGYHGFSDGFVSLSPPALGVRDVFHFKSFKDPEEIGDDVAAVIVEPIMTDISPARIEWLKRLREKCTEKGTVLIFDEVITGFRFPKLSVSNYYGITPDLICLGKAIANGLPLSVVGGKREIMDCGEYFVSSTFAGDTVALTAGLKTVHLLQTKYNLDYLWEKGAQFLLKFNSLYPEKLQIQGYPTRGVFVGDQMTKALFWQEAVKAGLLFGPSFFFNFNHVGVMDQVISTCSDIMTRIKTGQVALQGELPASPFAQRMRSQ